MSAPGLPFRTSVRRTA